jgi:transposase
MRSYGVFLKWIIRQVKPKMGQKREWTMLRQLRIRRLTAEEQVEIEKRVRSRCGEVREVERAQIVKKASAEKTVQLIARELQMKEDKVRFWIRRFNAKGLAGLEDEPRSGRPATYTPIEVSEVIASALTAPQQLGLPFSSWTLDRLAVYLNEVKGIAIKRSRIDDILLREGLRWRRQETWFGERVDPDFAEKRG